MLGSVLRKAQRVIGWISTFAFKLSSVAVVILALLTVEQVISRYLFSSGSVALQELEWHLFAVIFLLSIPFTLQKDKHVRVDIFYHRFSEKTKALVDLAALIFFVIPASLLIVWAGTEFVKEALSFQNPRAFDYYTAQYFSKGSFFYGFFSTVEGVIRRWVLVGEISPDPAGLEGRWIVKALIPLSFLILFFESLRLIGQKIKVLRSSFKEKRCQ